MNPYNGFSGTQRTRALGWLNGEYRAGRRHRPTSCDACGQTEGMMQAHSEDYSGPPFGDHIGQFSLCYTCHMMLHCRFRAVEGWNAYVAKVAAGWVANNPKGPNFGAITAALSGSRPFTWTLRRQEPKVPGFLRGLALERVA